jgi:hypothetical protein
MKEQLGTDRKEVELTLEEQNAMLISKLRTLETQINHAAILLQDKERKESIETISLMIQTAHLLPKSSADRKELEKLITDNLLNRVQ